MITPRQKREPAVGAAQICSTFVSALMDLRNFAQLHPREIDEAIGLFTEYELELFAALDTRKEKTR